MTQHRVLAPELRAAIAYHEAGHAVAAVLAFRHCQRPKPPPRQAVSYIEIAARKAGRHPVLGCCDNRPIYSTKWQASRRIRPQWQEAMEWEIVINIAGGISEAIHCGESSQKAALWRAMISGSAFLDFVEIDRVLADLHELTGRRIERPAVYRRYAARAMKLLKANWNAVEAIVAVLIRDGRIDGAAIEQAVRS
jgi:hypothetical protein